MTQWWYSDGTIRFWSVPESTLISKIKTSEVKSDYPVVAEGSPPCVST